MFRECVYKFHDWLISDYSNRFGTLTSTHRYFFLGVSWQHTQYIRARHIKWAQNFSIHCTPIVRDNITRMFNFIVAHITRTIMQLLAWFLWCLCVSWMIELAEKIDRFSIRYFCVCVCWLSVYAAELPIESSTIKTLPNSRKSHYIYQLLRKFFYSFCSWWWLIDRWICQL